MSENNFKHGIESPSKITFESYGVKYTWETDHSDLELPELMNAFYKLLIAQGFNNESILESMQSFADAEMSCLK